MGSLVPGWDADKIGGVPKALQDVDESAEMEGPHGYFAKLERSRTLKAQGSVEGPPASSVVGPHLGHCNTMNVPSLNRQSAPLSLARTSMEKMAHPVGSLERHSYKKTSGIDWSQELDSLRSYKSSGRTSLDHLAPHKEHQDKGWWARLDAGALNEPEQEHDDREGAKHSSFTPQFNLTGQHLQ